MYPNYPTLDEDILDDTDNIRGKTPSRRTKRQPTRSGKGLNTKELVSLFNCCLQKQEVYFNKPSKTQFWILISAVFSCAISRNYSHQSCEKKKKKKKIRTCGGNPLGGHAECSVENCCVLAVEEAPSDPTARLMRLRVSAQGPPSDIPSVSYSSQYALQLDYWNRFGLPIHLETVLFVCIGQLSVEPRLSTHQRQ